MIMHVAVGEVVLTTERLVLRRLTVDDAEALARYRSEPDVARMQSWTTPYTVAQATELIEHVAGHRIGASGWVQLGFERKTDSDLIGDCGINGHDLATVEIGFTLAKVFWGNGYATEACGAVVDHLLGPVGFTTVVAEADPGNVRSIALLQRLGFTSIGANETEAHFTLTRGH